MTEIYSPAEDSYLLSRILKEQLPGLLKENPDLNLLEIGVGSGIHLQTAFSLGVKKENIFSSDININSVNHCNILGFNCIQSDLFENIKDLWFPSEAKKETTYPCREGRLSEGNHRCPRFDLIIFNPPYLPEDKNEPKDSRIITTGGKKGNEIIIKFLKQAKDYLKDNGKIFLITSSLTETIDFKKLNYSAKEIGCERLFMERLCVWELM